MAKIAVYPGSFKPWHQGHQDVLNKAKRLFDDVVVAEFGVDFHGLLKDFVKENNFCAVVRGIRNPNDFYFEQANQYWNEDLGIDVPTIYFISDRKFLHISSSAIKEVTKALDYPNPQEVKCE